MYFSVSRKTQNPSVSGSGGSQRHAHGTELIHGFNLKTFPQQALHPPPHQLRYTLLILILILITLKHILPLHIWLSMSELLHNYDHYMVVVNSLNSDSENFFKTISKLYQHNLKCPVDMFLNFKIKFKINLEFVVFWVNAILSGPVWLLKWTDCSCFFNYTPLSVTIKLSSFHLILILWFMFI